MLAEVEPLDVDVVLLHVATNHLEAIGKDIRRLDRTLDQDIFLTLVKKNFYSQPCILVLRYCAGGGV